MVSLMSRTPLSSEDIKARQGFGLRLKSLRKQKRWTQKELAEKLGVRPTHVYKYESGLHVPPLEKIMFLTEIFNTTVDYLINGNSAPSSGLTNNRLLRRFLEVQGFPAEDQETVLRLIDAMVAKQRMTGAIQSLD